MTGKIQALVGCQIQNCAEEYSLPLHMVRMFKGEPICEKCYDEYEKTPNNADWDDLSLIVLGDLVA